MAYINGKNDFLVRCSAPTQEKTIDIKENGSKAIAPDAGYALSVVNVNVDVPSKEPNIQPLTINENGTYTASGDIDGYSPITVDIQGGGGSTPTQEKSVTITQNGSSEVIPDEGYALSKVTINTQVESGKQKYCLVRFYNDDRTTLLYEIIVPYGTSAVYAGDTPISTNSAEGVRYNFLGFEPSTANVTTDMNCYAVYEEEFLGTLETLSWAQISTISQAGTAQNYFAVGDTKPVYLKGTVGNLNLDNEYKVFILDFNNRENSGIIFGTFQEGKYNTNIALTGVGLGINHFGGDATHGGWAACDLRYDVLGSTDVAPFGYGSAKTLSSCGYDATPNCATTPVANTLMSALPADLRSVMKPMTIYTDNTGNISNVEANVTATVDYLPLLAEFEAYGVRKNANEFEQNKQSQYTYYANGKSPIKAGQGTTSSTYWWLRSPAITGANSVCRASRFGASEAGNMDSGYALSPIFLV